jgi:hypothetical protein
MRLRMRKLRVVVAAVVFGWSFGALASPPPVDGSWRYTSSAGRLTVTAMPTPGNPAFERFMGQVLNQGTGVAAEARMTAQIRGVSVPVTARNFITSQQVLNGISRAMFHVAVGLYMASVVNEARCRNLGQPLLPIFECEGRVQPGPVSQNGWRNNTAGQSGPFATVHAGCEDGVSISLNAGQTATFTRVEYSSNNTIAQCYREIRNEFGVVVNADQYYRQLEALGAVTQGCPPGFQGSTLGGVAFCNDGVYAPATQAEVADRVAFAPTYNEANRPQLVTEAGSAVDWSSGQISLSAPSQVQGESVTRTGTGTGGGTWTEVRQPVLDITCSGNQCTATQTDTVTRTERDAQGNVTSTSTTIEVVNPGAQQGGELQVCGLPDTPACRIDETGTLTAAEVEQQMRPEQDADTAYKGLRDFINDPLSRVGPFPQINWAFQLPTFCGPISLPAFAPYLTQIDVCQFQPVFHELMTVVWQLGALFGAIGLFWRDQLTQG